MNSCNKILYSVFFCTIFYILYSIFYIPYSITSGWFRVARGGSGVKPEMKRGNEPRLGLVHSVFEVGLKCVGRVSRFESKSRDPGFPVPVLIVSEKCTLAAQPHIPQSPMLDYTS